MNIEITLSNTIGKLEVEQVAFEVESHPEKRDGLYELTKHENKRISWHAWWVCETLARRHHTLFIDKESEIIEFILKSNHDGTERLALNILLASSHKKNLFSTPLFNFCLDTLSNAGQPPAIIAICIKLAYQMCLNKTDLMNELAEYLEYLQTDCYTPAVQATFRQTTKKIKKLKKIPIPR